MVFCTDVNDRESYQSPCRRITKLPTKKKAESQALTRSSSLSSSGFRNSRLRTQSSLRDSHLVLVPPRKRSSFNGAAEKVTDSESGLCDKNTAKENNNNKKSKAKISGYDMSIMNRPVQKICCSKTHVLWQRFYGFASEAEMDPTVESELFGVLEKTRLLVGDKKDSQYSRCGRTDKGVSSFGQVVALFLPSNLKKPCIDDENSSETVSVEELEGEIDYVRVLNRVLPDDVRVLGWCPAPVGFSARQ